MFPNEYDVDDEGVLRNALVQLWPQAQGLSMEFAPLNDQVTKASSLLGSFSARVQVTLDDKDEPYVVKVNKGDAGRQITQSEIESNKFLNSKVPRCVPKSVGQGTRDGFPDSHFYFCRPAYTSTLNREETAEKFVKILEELHGVENSETLYGYPIHIHLGLSTKDSVMCNTWYEFFLKDMDRLITLDQKINGEDDTLKELGKILNNKVIPRLLKKLTDDKAIRPVLVHGNLVYDKSCEQEMLLGGGVVLSSSAFWAPKEYDFALRTREYRPKNSSETWKSPFDDIKYFNIGHGSSINKGNFPGEFLDRLKLYSIHHHLHTSILCGPESGNRELIMETATELASRYGH